MRCEVPVFYDRAGLSVWIGGGASFRRHADVMLLAPCSSGFSDGVQLLRRKSGRAIMFN